MDDYMLANYNDRTILDKGTFLVKNFYDDMECECREDYRLKLKEWRKEMVGDRTMQSIFQMKIDEKDEETFEVSQNMQDVYHNFTGEWLGWLIESYKNLIDRIKSQAKKFTYLKLKAANLYTKKELDVEGARLFPIGELLGKVGGAKTSRVFFKCPIHNEKTPSFVWFVKDNRYKCFGCQAHGDVIDLYMKIYNCDFMSAVKALSI